MARKAARHEEAERNDQLLLASAKAVLSTQGAHVSVAAVAAHAGVGIATVYRRYRTKEELLQRLCVLALEQWIDAAEQGLAMPDPWSGVVHYITTAIDFGGGSLGSLAGTIDINDEMAKAFTRSADLWQRVVQRAQDAGALRADVTVVDLDLLIEQLGKPALAQHLEQQGRNDQLDAARAARRRTIAIVLDGLRSGHPTLPGEPPAPQLLTQRWERSDCE